VFRGAGVLNATEDLVVMDGLSKKKTDKNHAESGGSVDTVCMIEEDLFISGSDAGYSIPLTLVRFRFGVL
jgi:hypothetical protein